MAKTKTISLNPLAQRDGGRSEWTPGAFQRREVRCEADGVDLPPPPVEGEREDTVLMVLVTLGTWREIEELGDRLEMRPQEVISRALAEFKDRVDKATRTG